MPVYSMFIREYAGNSFILNSKHQKTSKPLTREPHDAKDDL